MDEKKCGQEFPVSYWQLAGTAPAGLKAPRGKTVLKAPRVLLFFVIAMTVFVFLGAPVQYWLGLGGVATVYGSTTKDRYWACHKARTNAIFPDLHAASQSNGDIRQKVNGSVLFFYGEEPYP